MSFGLHVGNSNGTKLSLSNYSLFLAPNSLFELSNKLSLNSLLLVSLFVCRFVIRAARTLQFIGLAAQNSLKKC